MISVKLFRFIRHHRSEVITDMFKLSSNNTVSSSPTPYVRNNKTSYTTVTSPREYLTSPREHVLSSADPPFHHSFCRSPFNVKISQINHPNPLNESSPFPNAQLNITFFPSSSKFSLSKRQDECANPIQDIDRAMERLNLGSDSLGSCYKDCENFGGNPDLKPETAMHYCCIPEEGIMKPRVMIHYMPHRTFETPILCTCVPALVDSRKKVVESTRQKTPKVKRKLPKTSTPAKNRRKLPNPSTPGKCRRVAPHASSPVTSNNLRKSRRGKKMKTTFSMTDLSSFRTTQANFLESLKNTYEMSDVLDGHASKKSKTSLKKMILRPYQVLKQKLSAKSEEPSMRSDQPYFRSTCGLTDFDYQYV